MTRIPTLPPQAPRTGSRFTRWLGRSVLRLGGWTIAGDWPDLPRLVVIAAPHSSGWDAVWGLAAKLAMGVDITFIAKAELFRGPLGWLLRKFGGHPVDRSAPGGIVDQTASEIRAAGRMWFVLAPEGTRKRVEHWKTGFWKIARRAGVPVYCAWFHYPDKTIGLGPLVELSDDPVADMARIRAIYRPYLGKNRGTD
ncbi:1-acyl-sn-glycerol-3-phosphate acyltransferase [Arenimonas terrae]|jgi:1-acyl-sn-glycerol-3-phosphate acyltransferase|uniref:Acyltransferase n=1 Tax=Arenimonas terrae TaxID=2546226 RepID=A0A5C4RP99_9GAMM|nr:1-acyl-sn-glycerol-3-phosphate acyltransferase [Arenimonas terrae]TNJ32749.1 acyltransferase [Arenimonas terrae]